jgi:hypothetical protein
MNPNVSMILMPTSKFPDDQWNEDKPPCLTWFNLLVKPMLKEKDVLHGYEATPEHCKFFVCHDTFQTGRTK